MLIKIKEKKRKKILAKQQSFCVSRNAALKNNESKNICICSNKFEFNTINKTNLCICSKIAIFLDSFKQKTPSSIS